MVYLDGYELVAMQLTVSIDIIKKRVEIGYFCCLILGGGGGDNSLYMTWYGCAARIAPFFSAARYTISFLFPRKLYMTDPFFLDLYMNGPIFTSLFKCAYFFAQIFSSETQIETKLYYMCVSFEYR